MRASGRLATVLLAMGTGWAEASIVFASVGGSLLLTFLSLTFLHDAGVTWEVPVTIATVVPFAVSTPIAFTLMALLRQLESSRQEAQQAATTDLLTGLFNRRQWLEVANPEMQRSESAGDAAAVMLLDVDHFKRVNDLYGHATGDAVLHSVARICRETLRPGDICARWGGEEFIVLLKGAETPHATQIAERLRSAVETSAVNHGERRVSVTASIGIASSREHLAGYDLEDLIHLADSAMYAAKQAGRNRVATPPADGPDFGSTARVRKLYPT
jgi:diguanylate cyclase (GGDEF)-like protein